MRFHLALIALCDLPVLASLVHEQHTVNTDAICELPCSRTLVATIQTRKIYNMSCLFACREAKRLFSARVTCVASPQMLTGRLRTDRNEHVHVQVSKNGLRTAIAARMHRSQAIVGVLL
jgi:hypothetical protein